MILSRIIIGFVGNASGIKGCRRKKVRCKLLAKGLFFKATVYFFVLFILSNFSLANKTIYVDDNGPADFNNIQAAMDDSNDGDIVLVAPGTYTGEGNRDIDFMGKAITVKSEYGPESCIIKCGGSYPGGDRLNPIEPEYHRGFYFHSNEDANSIVQGFTVTEGYMGPYSGGAFLCTESSPAIRDCIIVGNSATIGGGICASFSDIRVENCVIKENIASFYPWDWFYGSADSGAAGGICVSSGNALLMNCLVVGNAASSQGGGIVCGHGDHQIINCTVTDNRTGEGGIGGGISIGTGIGYESYLHNSIVYRNLSDKNGNNIELSYLGINFVMRLNVSNSLIEEDPNSIYDPSAQISGDWLSTEPMFARNGYWDPNGTSEDLSDDFWVDGDYHLKSQAGRFDPNTQIWVQDDVTSLCIDTGDPNSPIWLEPFPNGGYINMGAYGGTSEASKSYFGKPVCQTIVAGDINGDCRVDLLDMEIMLLHWLEDNNP